MIVSLFFRKFLVFLISNGLLLQAFESLLKHTVEWLVKAVQFVL